MQECNIDLTLIFTIIGAAAAVIGINVTLFSWLRSDMKSFENEVKTDMNSFKIEIRSWKEEIYKEMKDFHGRLCAIEEKTGKPKTDP